MVDDDKNPIDIYFDMKEGRVKLAKKKDAGSASLMNGYLALARTMVLVFQHSHWKCKGSNFYGNHLLFSRIYDDAGDIVDSIAEKLIGVFGNESLKHSEQVSNMSEVFEQFSGEDHFSNSLGIAELFLQLSEDVYNRIKEMNEMTLGLDDMIMAHSSKVEEFVYLLKQARV